MKFIVLLKNTVLGLITISVIFLLFVGYIVEIIKEKYLTLKNYLRKGFLIRKVLQYYKVK